jgi:hypothetical protein
MWPFGSRARQVEKAEVPHGTCEDRLSLFVVVSLRARSSWHGRPLQDWPVLETAGFASSWSAALAGRPRRLSGFDGHTIDKFVAFETSTSARSLATVHMRETYAYDMLYRSDIAATGLSIRTELHEQASAAIVELLTTHPAFDHGAESRSGCVFRFPARRVIVFPEPRGAENPYAATNGPEPLKDIGIIRSDLLEVGVTLHPSSPLLDWDTQPLGALLASQVLRLSM